MNRQIPTRRITFLSLLMLVLLQGISLTTSADVLVLNDGRLFEGEVADRTPQTINFRYLQDGIWVTRTFARSQIQSLTVKDGDQADGEQHKDDQTDDAEIGTDVTTKGQVPVTPVNRNTIVATIPLHGGVGGVTADGQVTGTFDAPLLRECLEEAIEQGATVAILDIDSPGGLVSEMEAICETILDFRDRIRIIAHPHEAYSAAAIITMCCREIAVRPNSMIGAATIVRKNDNGGMSALDAKFASPHYARQRHYMQQSGKPYDVVAAMTIQETQLWWSRRGGFTTERPDSSEYELVDGATTILTMTADDALKWNVANYRAETADQLAALLRLPRSPRLLDMSDVVTRYNNSLDRAFRSLREDFTTYFSGLAQLYNRMVTMFEAFRRGDDDVVNQMKRLIPRDVARIRYAGQRILKSDHASLAHRISVPVAFIERIEDDNELIANIGRLVDATSSDGWVEAATRLSEVIKRWQEVVEQMR